MAFENNARGIDVSLWQGDVDWVALKAAGVNFAFTKATQGDNVTDPHFAQNWPAMKAAGVLRGAYHFFRPAIDAAKQAAFFLQTVPFEKGDLPPALDVESSGGLTPANLASAVQTCLNEIERLSGLRPIIYTGPNVWNMSVASPDAPAWTSNYLLWIANYTTALKPALPKGWTSWAFWQYTDQGRLNGCNTTLDMDRYSGTLDDLTAWAASLPASLTAPATVPAEITALVTNYLQALNARDFDGLAALYAPAGVRTGASGTEQGPQAIRAWYVDWLTNQFPGGSFSLTGDISQVDTATWSFMWTCHNAAGDQVGQDTIGILAGKLHYHTSALC